MEPIVSKAALGTSPNIDSPTTYSTPPTTMLMNCVGVLAFGTIANSAVGALTGLFGSLIWQHERRVAQAILLIGGLQPGPILERHWRFHRLLDGQRLGLRSLFPNRHLHRPGRNSRFLLLRVAHVLAHWLLLSSFNLTKPGPCACRKTGHLESLCEPHSIPIALQPSHA